MRHRTRIALLLAGLLPGCYWEPSASEIMVETSPPGASCMISQRGAPLGIAEPTPAITVIALADAEIGVTCRRAGFAEAAVTLPPPASAVCTARFLSEPPPGNRLQDEGRDHTDPGTARSGAVSLKPSTAIRHKEHPRSARALR